MCGRFTSTEDKEKIIKLFPNIEALNYSHKSYNISPSNIVNIIYENNHKLLIDTFIWSYSFFSKQNNVTQFVINARIETINDKYLFKESFTKRKCLIIANGYYEWKNITNQKQPYLISIPKNELIFFGGIWREEIRDNKKICLSGGRDVTQKIPKFAFSNFVQKKLKFQQQVAELMEVLITGVLKYKIEINLKYKIEFHLFLLNFVKILIFGDKF